MVMLLWLLGEGWISVPTVPASPTLPPPERTVCVCVWQNAPSGQNVRRWESPSCQEHPGSNYWTVIEPVWEREVDGGVFHRLMMPNVVSA